MIEHFHYGRHGAEVTDCLTVYGT